MTWTLDNSHTEVGFSVKHMMVSTVRGRFTDVEADIKIDEANPEQSRVVARINTESVDTNNADRDAHLRSADFFDSENHPVMTFESREVTRKSDNEFEVTGDLTIRDVTRPVVLTGEFEGPVKDPWGGERIGFDLKGELDREEFGLTWNAALEAGGVMVAKTVKLHIEAQLARQPVATA